MLSKKLKEELKSKLLKKLKISSEALRKRVERKASKFNVSLDSAYLIFAKEHGLIINKYLKNLTPAEREEIRDVLGIRKEIIVPPRIEKQRIQKIKEIFKYEKLSLGPRPPLITLPLMRKAEEMGGIYPVLYIFENSLRNFISLVLEKKYGKRWWKSKVSKKVRENVNKRIQTEKLNPWCTARGVHPIFYTDFSDLAKILNQNAGDFNKFFKGVSGGLNWLIQRLEELKMLRNNIAHTSPLSKKDQERFFLYFDDWYKQLNIIIKKFS